MRKSSFITHTLVSEVVSFYFMLHNFRGLLFWDLTRVLRPYAISSTIKTRYTLQFLQWNRSPLSLRRKFTFTHAQFSSRGATYVHVQFQAHEKYPSSLYDHIFNPPFLPFHGFCSAPISEDRWDTRTAHLTHPEKLSFDSQTDRSFYNWSSKHAYSSIFPTGSPNALKFQGAALMSSSPHVVSLHNFEKERASKSALNYASRELYAFKNVIR